MAATLARGEMAGAGRAGLATAALTAGTVVAARHLFDRFSQGDSPSGRRGSLAPRYADLSPAEREAMRKRMRSRDAEAARAAQHIRAPPNATGNPAPPRAARGNR
ncbi:hypothetical protein [Paracoccus thiocyanatus]|uniref:hypothetical protein n=1 Tax=Paracoccus thiocyanatus TaxID=34006 RepID=UPI002163CB71|nr:hypothetical protein [Paracoccus thiocyanatus]